MEKEKCNHPAYGELPASELTILHLNEWLAAHPTWNGSRRMKVQAVKRAMNYGVQAKLIPSNPVKDCPCGRSATRIAYLTEEQEAAVLKQASPAFKIAVEALYPHRSCRSEWSLRRSPRNRSCDPGAADGTARLTPKKTQTSRNIACPLRDRPQDHRHYTR